MSSLNDDGVDPNASFANVAYDAVEASGPPSAPLGFHAPQVHRTEIRSVLCFDESNSTWSDANAIVHRKHGDDYECQPEFAYMLTQFTLKRTICGEIIKGVLIKPLLDDGRNEQKISEHNSNLWQMTGEEVAIKIDRRKSMEMIHKVGIQHNPENPWKEVAAMQLLGDYHPHVMGLRATFMDEKCLYEVMNYCPNGTLSEMIRSYPRGLTEFKARDIFTQVLKGVYFIHSKGICHHDISTSNIMIDEGGKCVVIDFGMA